MHGLDGARDVVPEAQSAGELRRFRADLGPKFTDRYAYGRLLRVDLLSQSVRLGRLARNANYWLLLTPLRTDRPAMQIVEAYYSENGR